MFQKENGKFFSTITGLEEEVTLVNSKLENMTKSLRMLNSETDILKEILRDRVEESYWD